MKKVGTRVHLSLYEDETSAPGDIVEIIECRPRSRLKRWELVRVVAKSTAVDLAQLRSGARANAPMMMTIAAKLSDAEIKAVSDYIAGLR